MSDTQVHLHEVYHRYIEAINNRELDRMHEFAHDQLTFNGEPVSRDDYVAAIQGHLAAVEDFVWRLDDLVIEGDRVAARLTDTGTPVTEWLGLQPTGKAVEFTEYAFYHFRDGRFEDMWYLLDTRAVQSQLGA
ncbi:ester cyclase [Auraticoccus monumenti]|uniref:Predicted ester cyclase n=1 Tax=Auraticoccus monumenti TaxID=675864 RepID=A0A1G6SSF8_9ACTN|nr:ester cyclase [Auraticoccus monumenti]SDD19157.1 Predicted ester cyclase [Auraticoccus monumenti]